MTTVTADTFTLGEGPGVADLGDGTFSATGDNVYPSSNGDFSITY